MKLIVTKAELTAIQNNINWLVEDIKNEDLDFDIPNSNIVEILNTLKDESYIKYRFLTGDFEVTISEEFYTDITNLIGNVYGLLVPFIKPALKVCDFISKESKIIADKYASCVEDEENEELNEHQIVF